MDRPGWIEQTVAALVVISAFAVRAWGTDQPIVENYIGRQIPTAMVARGLDSGQGDFFAPVLRTGPFPNYFIVEPPVFAWLAVQIHRATGSSLEAAGRRLSALGLALAVWGLWGLVRHRQGPMVACAAAIALAAFPVALRYGRAFQGDALMLGCLTASIRCYDEAGSASRAAFAFRWIAAGWLLGSLALALKVTAILVWLPLAWAVAPKTIPIRVHALALIPTLLWYANAASLLWNTPAGSQASADNLAIWLRALAPSALFEHQTWAFAGRYLGWTCFTLAALPLWIAAWLGHKHQPERKDRLWMIWTIAAATMLLVLARKAHHEYYWLMAAPPAAIGAARGWEAIRRRSRTLAVLAALGFLAMATRQAAPTWRTPAEWIKITEAAALVSQTIPRSAWLIAPEALIHHANRQGCRLELEPESIRRAAGEWGIRLDPDQCQPDRLVEVYCGQGADYFADLAAGPNLNDPVRRALHDYIRRHHQVIADRPGVALIAKLKGKTSLLTLHSQVPNPERGADP